MQQFFDRVIFTIGRFNITLGGIIGEVLILLVLSFLHWLLFYNNLRNHHHHHRCLVTRLMISFVGLSRYVWDSMRTAILCGNHLYPCLVLLYQPKVAPNHCEKFNLYTLCLIVIHSYDVRTFIAVHWNRPCEQSHEQCYIYNIGETFSCVFPCFFATSAPEGLD